MKFFHYVLLMILVFHAGFVNAKENENMTRSERADQTYEQLFLDKRSPNPTDPEFMEILQRNIFGEVFYTGNLDNKERELVTVVALATMQTLPQLKAHIGAALNVGNSPLEIREAIYQCAPFIGFPRTLNAIGVFNEVARERNIKLPLADTGTTTDADRHEKGLAVQKELYGNEVKKAMASLPGEYKDIVPNTLTDFCFGDFYTRGGLTVQQRELLALVILTTLGAEKQLRAHVVGALKAGNDKEYLLAVMVQAIPYIGLANAMTTINLIKEADVDNYKPIYEEKYDE